MAANGYENRLLASLASDDLARLQPQLKRVRLRYRQQLEAARRPITAVYFPLAGIVSVIAMTSDRRHQTEVTLIGREGMTGCAIVLGMDAPIWSSIVQIEGDALSIGATELIRVFEKSASLRLSLLRYVHVLLGQLAHGVVASARGRIQQRLARWLLMAQDRMGTNELALTHDFLALMLGVRRAGVSVALDTLESQGLVFRGRGTITITDRYGLEAVCEGLYGEPEREMARPLSTL